MAMKRSSTLNTLIALATSLFFMASATGALAQTVHYTATFDATWSATTHPTDFPPGPHFSGLVGGTHDATVSFWEVGQPASLGIKRMAEWGSQADLLAEVQSAIDAGQAETTIADDPLWTVPGTTSVALAVTEDFSLVTLVAMIAPSPDWFIGVRNLDLAPGGVWTEELVIDLYAFDAGTDSGPTYTSPDQATVPPDPIAAINGDPFAAGVPLGTLTFTKQYVADVPAAASLSMTAYPNPFNPSTTIAWELPTAGNLRVDIHDALGRRVRTLWSGMMKAGPGLITWNGHDESGRQTESGVYLARLTTDTRSLTRKIMLVK
jgi:hypothetical protein